MSNWMIYGATGYTGKLLAEEAVRRGHRPILAGRSASKLKPMAERLGLDYVAFDIQDSLAALQETKVELVLHSAGPFIFTSTPMLKACLQTGTHYLDITGEIGVFENTFAHDAQARAKNLVLMSGVGFDIIPTDCLAKYVAEKLPDAKWLEVALFAPDFGGDEVGMTAGTMKSALDMIAKGNLVRRGGELVHYDLGKGAKTFRFPQGERLALPIPWGDLSTAYRTTGIPNITTYMALAKDNIRVLGYIGTLVTRLMRIKPLREWLSDQIDQRITGPGEEARVNGRSHIYARVMNEAGQTAEAWLETLSGYEFTMIAAVRAAERVMDGHYSGALTPAGAFGADFVMEIPGTQRHDVLMV